MDKVKFRAFYKGDTYPLDPNDLDDHEKPQMVYEVQNLYDGQGVKHNGTMWGRSAFGELLNDDDFIVMQYTGIDDNNGVEIYVGDIVEIDCGTYKDIDSIIFSRGAFRFSNGDHLPIGEDMKVLGNVHENPNLIQK